MRIEEKEYTKSIDLSIWKKNISLSCTKKKYIDHGCADESALFSCGHYYAFVPAPCH